MSADLFSKQCSSILSSFLFEGVILNIDEPIQIEGLGDVLAKIDTGNEAYNVLHGLNIQDNGKTVGFDSVDGKHMELPKVSSINIHIGSGHKEERPVVSLSFTLKGKLYKDIEFSLSDRSQNEQPVLIGEPFLKSIGASVKAH